MADAQFRVPDGPSYLYMTHLDGSHFPCNPFKIHRELGRCLSEGNHPRTNIKWARKVRSGSMLLHVVDRPTALTMMSQTSFLDKAITIDPADRLNCIEALAHAPSLLDCSEEELAQELRTQGVVSVKRLRPRNGKTSPLLRFSFLGNRHPAVLKAGYEVIPLRLWINPPLQCRACAHFGHGARSCRAKKKTCLRCSGQHHTDQCKEQLLRCPYCEGPHAGWDRTCPAYQDQMRRTEEAQRDKAGPPIEPVSGHSLADAVVQRQPRRSGVRNVPSQASPALAERTPPPQLTPAVTREVLPSSPATPTTTVTSSPGQSATTEDPAEAETDYDTSALERIDEEPAEEEEDEPAKSRQARTARASAPLPREEDDCVESAYDSDEEATQRLLEERTTCARTRPTTRASSRKTQSPRSPSWNQLVTKTRGKIQTVIRYD